MKMQREMLLLMERFVVAVEGISGNVSGMSVSLNDISTNISYLVAEKKRTDMPDLPLSSNIIQPITKVTTDPPNGTSFDKHVTFIGSADCCSLGDKDENFACGEGTEVEDERCFLVEDTSLHGLGFRESTVPESQGASEINNPYTVSCNEPSVFATKDCLAVSLKREPNEELENAVDGPEDETIQEAEFMLLPKREPVFEVEEEMNEAEDMEECVTETSNLQSASNVMSISWELNNPGSLHNTWQPPKQAHTGEKPFKCQECGKSFATKGYLVSHMHIHTDKPCFKCSICGKAFNQSTSLKRHVLLHTGEKPFKCSECKKAFALKHQLIAHMRIHTGQKPFNCSLCGKAFKQSGHLTSHLLSHTGERPFTCKVCGRKFRQGGSLSQHMRIVHPSASIPSEEWPFQSN